MDGLQGRDDGINLLDWLVMLLRRKKFIISVTVGVTLLAAVISLVIPETFKAESKILPPVQSQSLSGQLLGQLNGLAGSSLLPIAGARTPNDLYVGLLKTRTVLDAIVDRFKLMDSFKSKYREDARRKLAGQLTTVDEKKSGIITVGVEAGDPKIAADLANAFVEELINLNKSLAITEASQRRLFYEDQLKEAKEALLASEDSMKGFQEKTGAVRIDEQAKAVIQNIGQARAQIAAKEVQLRVMKTYATQQNPDTQRLEEEIRGLKEQLGRLEANGAKGADPLMSTGRIPQVGTDYARRLRDLKFNESLNEILLKQFEAAKLDEAKDAAVIQVIEKAVPPERKFAPSRSTIVIAAFVVSLFLSLCYALFLGLIERSRQIPGNKERFAQIRRLASLQRDGKA
jgi:tyrosine-protein kinase Etk/Wzc